MSNPTVFELNKIMIRDNIFIIEDNIAESIHFHLGLVRFDLSIKEFNDISTKFINILNEGESCQAADLSLYANPKAASLPLVGKPKKFPPKRLTERVANVNYRPV